MNKVFLDDVQRDPTFNGHTLESWLLSIRDNPDVMHVYHQAFEYNWGWQFTDELSNLAHSVNSQDNYKLIFGSHKVCQGCYRNHPLSPPGSDNIIFWPEAWMYRSGYYLTNPNNIDTKNHPRVTGNWSGKYTCLMNKLRHHRYEMLKHLSEFDSDLSEGLVTWAIGVTDYDWDTDDRIPPELKYLKHNLNPNKAQYLDNTVQFDFFLKPTNFHNYWFDFIVETECDYMFYTEKTWRSIVYGKPFVIIGAQSQNSILKQWGFQLFPELIDYRFDHIESLTRHRDLIKPVIDLTTKDMCELDHLWMPRYKHNYELWKYIIMSDDHIPEIIREEIYGWPQDFYRTDILLSDIRRYVSQHKPDFKNGIYI